MPSFRSLLDARIQATGACLCVGIDPKTYNDDLESTCRSLINATAPYAACYKPNGANLEERLDVMQELNVYIHSLNIPVLLDVKRGDIGSTAVAYARTCYEYFRADAVTLSPLMGWDSVEPFCRGNTKNI